MQYQHELEGIGDIITPKVAQHASSAYHLYVIRTEKRDALQEYLTKSGIGTLIHYPVPPHLQKAYKDLGYQKGDFPLAEKIADTCLSLPIYPGLTSDEVSLVCQNIQHFFNA
jgi:dTDP-4-amino-4,6-dideoxygalactose transaminase